jgi:hypothetical protein
VRVVDTAERSVNGIPALGAAFEVTTEQGTLRGVMMVPSMDGRVYAVYGYSVAADWSRYEGAVTGALSSFQRESDPSILAAEARRLQVVELGQALPFAQFMRQYPSSVPEATVALINQVREDESLPRGLAKRVQ